MKSKTRSASGQGTRGSGSATPGSAAKSRDVDVDVACIRNGAGHFIGASVAPSTRNRLTTQYTARSARSRGLDPEGRTGRVVGEVTGRLVCLDLFGCGCLPGLSQVLGGQAG